METWIRDDGRYYCLAIGRDLFGLVVRVAYGGRRRPSRVRTYPAIDESHACELVARIVRRRAAHGYRREG